MKYITACQALCVISLGYIHSRVAGRTQVVDIARVDLGIRWEVGPTAVDLFGSGD